MTKTKRKVKISWGEDSRESNSMSYTLWIVKNLIRLGVPDIKIETLDGTPASKQEVDKVIGKVGEPLKSPKNGFISTIGGRIPGQPRFSSKHALNNKTND